MEEYKFWKTQPVSAFDETIDKEGPIDVKTVDQVEKEPYKLLGDFEWSVVDVNDKSQLQELYELLYGHYIEDDDESFRFQYHPQFLEWALKSPGWEHDWHVGVRVKTTKKLVAFISGIPQTLRIRDNEPFTVAEINFLCVHKKLRSKRLAPLLIREVTRRVNLKNIWQALYTAGVVLPSPISVPRYFHRPLNWTKLNDVGFSAALPGQTPAQMVARYTLPKELTISSIRPMTPEDVPQVHKLLTDYLTKFDIAPIFTHEEVHHWFLGKKDNLFEITEETQPVYAYVVPSKDDSSIITDFFSFYRLNSTVLNNPKHVSLNIAYGYYYASTVGIGGADNKVDQSALKSRLKTLYQNALILAKNLGFDVFNAVSNFDNPLFLDELKFGVGTGDLNFYLFNYRAFPIHSGFNNKVDGLEVSPNGGGVGVMLL